MKNIFSYFLALTMAIFMMSCGESEPQTGDDTTTDESPKVLAADTFPATKGGITLTAQTNSPAYADAALSLAPLEQSETGEAVFDFTVTNYMLGEQTADAADKGLANSGKGQHIHLIVNNGPYFAKYESSFTHPLEEGNNVILAFLARSYHESVKNANSFVLTQTASDDAAADLEAPHMFYSRPKGTYTGAGNVERVLLDFFIVNSELSAEGNRVRATINGNEFVTDTWVPYVMTGLPMGENTVKLEFLTADGTLIQSPFNPVERTFTLEAEEAQ